MEKKFVDTNIFLRYLTKDDPSKYERCRELFKKAIEAKITLATSGMIIAELIWTLLSYYKVPKAEVVDKISIIVATDNLFIPDKEIMGLRVRVWVILYLFEHTRKDFQTEILLVS